MEDLIEWLANYSFDHNIGYILTHLLSPSTPSTSYGNERLVIINMNWANANEIPFSFAHEIGHILNGDKGKNSFSAETVNTKSEYEANITGIKLLISYCKSNDMIFTNAIKFCEAFSIPANLEYVVSLLLKEKL